MMENLTLKAKLQNGSKWLRMNLKDNISSSICCHTYKGHIKRLRLKASHFSYAATHTKDTLDSEE